MADEQKIVERLAQYKKLTENIKKLEDALDQVKKMRSEVAKNLLEENGKEQLYDLGDGVKLFVSATKIGTYFLAPRKRRGKGTGKKKKTIKDGKVVDATPEAAPSPAPTEAKAEPDDSAVTTPTDTSSGMKTVSEPNVIEASATLSASGTVKAAEAEQDAVEASVHDAIDEPEAAESDGSEDDFDPADYLDDEPEADSPPEEPEPASTPDPEPKAAPEASPPAEVDALEAALAELQPDKT